MGRLGKPLPPHPGGTAIVGFQLLVGFAKLGHSVRALAPITAEALGSGVAFAAAHPKLGISRYVIPYLDSSPDVLSLISGKCWGRVEWLRHAFTIA